MAQQVISASRVRRFLAQGEVEKALELVPNTTKKFILSKEGQGITQVLKTNLDSSN
jgi:citrate lyase synthetase